MNWTLLTLFPNKLLPQTTLAGSSLSLKNSSHHNLPVWEKIFSLILLRWRCSDKQKKSHKKIVLNIHQKKYYFVDCLLLIYCCEPPPQLFIIIIYIFASAWNKSMFVDIKNGHYYLCTCVHTHTNMNPNWPLALTVKWDALSVSRIARMRVGAISYRSDNREYMA